MANGIFSFVIIYRSGDYLCSLPIYEMTIATSWRSHDSIFNPTRPVWGKRGKVTSTFDLASKVRLGVRLSNDVCTLTLQFC